MFLGSSYKHIHQGLLLATSEHFYHLLDFKSELLAGREAAQDFHSSAPAVNSSSRDISRDLELFPLRKVGWTCLMHAINSSSSFPGKSAMTDLRWKVFTFTEVKTPNREETETQRQAQLQRQFRLCSHLGFSPSWPNSMPMLCRCLFSVYLSLGSCRVPTVPCRLAGGGWEYSQCTGCLPSSPLPQPRGFLLLSEGRSS